MNSVKAFILFALLIGYMFSCGVKSTEPIFVGFKVDTSSIHDSLKTQNSFKVMDNFFILNYSGAYDDRTSGLQEWFNNNADKNYKPAGCSVFYTFNDAHQGFLGQNLDAPDCGVLLGKYSPPNKYKSFSISKVDDMIGFSKSTDPSNLTDFQKTCILYFPFYAVGGINEHGLTVGIASIPSQKIIETENRSPIFVTNFIRQLLDNCKTIDEAVKLSHTYYLFDRSINTISHHFLIADSTGKSVLIEYKNGKMDYVFSDENFQFFTNKNVINNSIDNLNRCWRYKIMSNQLSTNTDFNSKDGLQILKRAKNNTIWSVIYDQKNREGTFTIYGDFTKVYKFSFSDTAALQVASSE